MEIEKGIPVPESANRRLGDRKYPLDKMEVGDSFFVTGRRPSFKLAAAKLGIICTSRKEKDGFRVWRIK